MMVRKPPKFSKKDQQKRFVMDVELVKITTGLEYALEYFNGVWRVTKARKRKLR